MSSDGGGSDLDDVRGLNLVTPGRPPSARLSRLRQQLRTADAQIAVELDDHEAEPEACARLRIQGQEQLANRLYEAAEETFLDALDEGLKADYFCWQAAVNIVNCQLFLRRLEAADETAAALLEMYSQQPEHALHYLCATQRGAIAAERHALAVAALATDRAAAEAQTALDWARAAYRWQLEHRGRADGLRAYNLVVALLRAGAHADALELYAAHRTDEAFLTWCGQGEHAEQLAALAAELPLGPGN